MTAKAPPPLFLMSARATLGGADSAGGACRSALHPRAAPPTLLPGDAQPSALLANRTKTTMWVRKGRDENGGNEDPGKRRHQRAGRRSDKDLKGAPRRHHPQARLRRRGLRIRAYSRRASAGAPAPNLTMSAASGRAATPIAMSPLPAAGAMEELRLQALSLRNGCGARPQHVGEYRRRRYLQVLGNRWMAEGGGLRKRADDGGGAQRR